MLPPIEKFDSSIGVRIYRMPVLAFPTLLAYTYLLVGECTPTLVDCGSGYGDSNDHLIAALQAVQCDFGEKLELQDIQRIFITHGHIDHHGGLSFIRQELHGAKVGIHPLDRRILVAYEERVVVSTKNLRVYLQRAGVSEKRIQDLLNMYGFAKRLITSEKVDFLLEEGTEIDGMTFIHAPGHCSGQVCIRIGDVLLTADHILSRITPHQAPESITHYTGLGHYLDSLEKVKRLDGVRLGLGGHEEPITDIYARIEGIKEDHHRKLERILDIIRSAENPVTISDVSKAMYSEVHGYQVLLALEEIGAHIEYLYERGELAVCNLDEIEQSNNPVLLYRTS